MRTRGRDIVNQTQPTGYRTNAAFLRAAHADRCAMWHLSSTMAIPTVGAGFKPYVQRPKERLS
jgi:hypothetical protein